MCLAIAPDNKKHQGPLARTWSRITSTPLKLLSLGAIIHLLIITGLLLFNDSTAIQLHSSNLLPALLYGVAPLVLFGFLLTWLPRRYSLSPAHHGRYGSIYLLSMIALCLIECGVITGKEWGPAGLFILMLSWITALQALRRIHSWLPANTQQISRLLLLVLTLNLTLLCVEFVTSLTGFTPRIEYTLIPLTIIFALELVLSAILFYRGSENSRVIVL